MRPWQGIDLRLIMKTKHSAEFEKFDKTMTGLLAVPYSELQEKLREEKRVKTKQKRKRATSPVSRDASHGKKRVV